MTFDITESQVTTPGTFNFAKLIILLQFISMSLDATKTICSVVVCE